MNSEKLDYLYRLNEIQGQQSLHIGETNINNRFLFMDSKGGGLARIECHHAILLTNNQTQDLVNMI